MLRVKWYQEKDSFKQSMRPEEQEIIERKLEEIAEILYKNTPEEELDTFETIELSVREHLLTTVAAKIGEFFFNSAGGTNAGRKRQIKSCLGQITLSSKQAIRLKLKKGTRLSPQMEKCCSLIG